MKQQSIATSSSEVVQAVCQRLAQHKPPTITQTKDLLEQIAIAELEIEFLRSALVESAETLEATLLALARQAQDGQGLQKNNGHSQHAVRTELYDLLITRAWERNNQAQGESLTEKMVGA
ncbi:MAG: hypothetical protein MI924_29450 [Chloroflexales bacterium]|nr:hypothetical protein [Chloroflexales bacterium]